MIKELDQIVLTTDLPEYGLQASDIGTVVLVHQGGAGYEVEFMTLAGASLYANQVRSIAQREIACVRSLEAQLQAA